MTRSRIMLAQTVLCTLCISLLILPMPSQAFDTLDGDATRWPNTPNYSIGRLNPELDA